MVWGENPIPKSKASPIFEIPNTVFMDNKEPIEKSTTVKPEKNKFKSYE